MPVPRGSAVFGGLLAVLGGLGTVGLGLEPVQSCLLPLFARGVGTRRSSITSLDQVGAIAGAQITIASTPVPIDASPTTVGRGILAIPAARSRSSAAWSRTPAAASR